jgi:hypothetical protein
MCFYGTIQGHQRVLERGLERGLDRGWVTLAGGPTDRDTFYNIAILTKNNDFTIF